MDFCQIGPLTTTLAALKRLKKMMSTCFRFSFIIDVIHLKLAGNKDVHEILDEFEYGHIQALTAEFAALSRVPEKYPIDVNVLLEIDVSILHVAFSFLIESSSQLLVTRTCKQD